LSPQPGPLFLLASVPSEPSRKKFKPTTKGLQRWSDQVVGQVNFQLALAREILHQFEIAQDSRQQSSQGVRLKSSLKKHSLALASLQHTIARLRSRISWLHDGDANTKIFHLQARHQKRKKLLERLCPVSKFAQVMKKRLLLLIIAMKFYWVIVLAGSTLSIYLN